ncbi:MarR family winged helix-turn-helix transcriptional regulator [Nocardia cyriacigeorgica]|uniref:MarR family winged helix-turn-helix transcriptional regulator n=1 Tax=Nocardia cyriacigeorgica TaxID=135487 RepID=UPI0024545BCD|nr:MarR family transcriptional regulator [Nocardia cyriacigeorgica]
MRSLHDIADSGDTARAATDRVFELAEVLGAMMQRGMAERGLTPARARLLWALHHSGPVTQRTLADLLQVTPRTITGLLDGLAADGYVQRKAHPQDRRAQLVTLTDRGRAFTATLQEGRDTMAHALFGDTPLADLHNFLAVLDKVVATLRGDDSQADV